jgi:thiamine-phosphate pyrophosphorylase
MPSTPLLRLLDAALNRAGEGLRVVEDYVRFVLDDPFLTRELKSLRHELTAASAGISTADRHAARDTLHDVGTAVATPSEQNRSDAWSVCTASLKRAEQSLRSLEEFGKLTDVQFAQSVEALRYRLYTLEKAIDIGRSSRERLDGARLCVLVDGRASVASFEKLVAALVSAGVGMIQLRDKHLADRELLARARLLVSLTGRQPPAPPGVSAKTNAVATQPPAEPGADGRTRYRPLAVINDRADIAAIVGADGVHLGQEDLPVKDARAIVGTRMLIGVSTHNIEQARAAVLDGANYLGAGPTFPSRTKAFEDFAGLTYLKHLAAEIHVPTFAIGGISADNLHEVLATGIARVAVGAAITSAGEPTSAARELLGMLNTTAAKAAAPFGS